MFTLPEAGLPARVSLSVGTHGLAFLDAWFEGSVGMSDHRQSMGVLVVAMALVPLWAGCTVSVSDAGSRSSGGGDAPSGEPPTDGDTGGGGGQGTTDPNEQTVQSLVEEQAVPEAFRYAGDSIAAKRVLMPGLFGQVDDLVAGGSQATEASLSRFDGSPTFDQDEELFLLAYALEQINDPASVGRLVDFLDRNITNALPATLAGVTHAVRSMTGMTLSPTFFYHASDIEETITAARGGSLKATASSDGTRSKGNLQVCYREFIVKKADGTDAVWPADHPQAGQPIKLSGTILPSDTLIRQQDIDDESARVLAGGGTPVDFTDPNVPGVTWQGEPTRTFNCAGFVFREFNDGANWNAAPSNWFDALRNSDALERVSADVDAMPGDIVWYFAGGDLPAHVAEVQSAASGNITVINADRWSGLFTADIDAEYFVGANVLLQALDVGLETRYSSRQIWRLKSGAASAIRPNVDREVGNSCHGEDIDGDGFPETDTCTAEQRCLTPEFVDGFEPQEPDAYVVMLVTNYGSMEGGYLTVRLESAIGDPPLLSSLPGGGIDPELLAQWTPFSQDRFDFPEDAADSLCGGFSDFFRPVLASFILAGTHNGTNFGVDQVFQSQCEAN